MADSHFEIVDGVLKKYTGTDKEVIVPEGVVELGYHCFVDAHFMESITFPSTLKKVEYNIVATDYAGYKYALKRVNVDSLDTWMNIDFTDNKANLLDVSDEMELYIDGKLVTDLVISGKYKVVKSHSFFGYKKLNSVVFEDGVEVIEKGAFARSGITKAVLPESVKDLIGERRGGYFSSPFQNCENLKEINIPKGIKVLPNYFLDGTAIENIELPEGLEIIPVSCFNYCQSLKSINIPSSVHTVKEHAFNGCNSLEEIIFPDSVHFIGTMSFTNIKRIILPENWSYIGNKHWSLIEHSKLDKLEMNEYDNALYIGSRTNPYQVLVRAKNKDIESCIIHKDCQYILGCSSHSYGNMGFYECKNIKSLALPKHIKRIEFGTLSNCDSLESVDLPGSFGVLDPKVYDGSPKLKFKEFGVKDKVIHLEKSVEQDDEIIKEEIFISNTGINLVSSKTLGNGEVVTTRFKKMNKLSSERLIAIFSLLMKAKEMKEKDYLNNFDVYKVTFPINNIENVTKYIFFDEELIRTIYSLVRAFIGKYFLINAHYLDTLNFYRDVPTVSNSVPYHFNEDAIREEIEQEYHKYNFEELGELLEKARDSGDFLSYEKINLYMNKLKNNGEWDRNYGEE